MKKIYLLLLCLAFVGCLPENTYCPAEETEIALDQLRDALNQLDDAVELADKIPRVSLAPHVENILDIKRDVKNLEVPKCLASARHFTKEAAGYAAEAFMAFMREEPDQIIDNNFIFMLTSIEFAEKNIQGVNECLPQCTGE